MAEVAERPKIPIPTDWLPGLPEEEQRNLCNRGVRAARVFKPDVEPTSTLVRDAARRIWEVEHPKETPPWARD